MSRTAQVNLIRLFQKKIVCDMDFKRWLGIFQIQKSEIVFQWIACAKPRSCEVLDVFVKSNVVRS